MMKEDISTRKMSENRVFVDTNVLVNYIIGEQKNVECIKYLFTLKGKTICISSLSVAQIVAIFQKKWGNNDIERLIKHFQTKFKILPFSEDNIEKSLYIKQSNDYEDKMQYSIGCKGRCFYFITNNIKDYRNLMNISVLHPEKVRTINR